MGVVVSPVPFDTFATPPGVQLPPGTPDAARPPMSGGRGGPAVGAPRSEVLLRHAAASPAWIVSLCDTLREARARLADRDARELAAALGRVGERFLDPVDSLRIEALALLPATSGLSDQMCEVVLDGMAADWTGPRLTSLVESELGNLSILDGFVPVRGDDPGRRAMAVGPALCLQIVAGGVPGVGVSALLRSLLVKGPTLLKPGLGDVVLPVLFARALAEADRALSAALAVVYWPGGSRELEGSALSSADVVTAYGSDATVGDLRGRTPVGARFVAYHHRVSVGVLGRGALETRGVQTTATEVAWALACFDQRGCVSPRVIYVEEGGDVAPERFAEVLAEALTRVEARLPTGSLDPGEASALHQARGTAELVAAGGPGRVLHGGAAAWTVVYEPAPSKEHAGGPSWRTAVPPVGRFAFVRPLPALESLTELLAPVARHLQTVGVAGLGDRLEWMARAVGRLGAVRVAPFRSLPFPPPWWHHDGGGPLTDLVRWVDLEPE